MTDQPDSANVRELARSKAALQVARDERRVLEKEVERINKELGLMQKIARVNTGVSSIKPPRRTKGNRAIPHLFLSDLHLDEVVRQEEVEGVNAYNRSIALRRLDKTFTSTVKILRDYWTGIGYDGIHVLLGGDIFSGLIHDELKESNEDTIFGSLLYWQDPIIAGLQLLADEFGQVHIASVVGNHGRNTRKPRAKFRARDNFDWFFSMQLARLLEGDKRFSWTIPDSMDATITAYDRTIRLTHGDQVNGGGGIGGIWPPIMRLDARKRQRQSAIGVPYDLLVMGHWHQLTWGPSFIINGSLKGYDEFAYSNNFGFERPQQALWLMAPGKGRTWTTPVWSDDREAEGW
jgi:hypothetical protein